MRSSITHASIRRRGGFLLLLVSLPGLAGPSPGAAGAVPGVDQEATALICGAIDMSRVPARLDWVDLLRIDVEPAEVVTLKARDGLFWGAVTVSGRYRYLRYGGSDDSGGPDLVYLFPPEGVSWAEFDPARPDPEPPALGQRDVLVTAPGLYWLGARRVLPEGPTRYHTVTASSPGEREALERLVTIIEDPVLREIVRRRLNEIGTD